MTVLIDRPAAPTRTVDWSRAPRVRTYSTRTLCTITAGMSAPGFAALAYLLMR